MHGRPTAPVFRSQPGAASHGSYELTWTVDSYTAVEEYRLLYRPIRPVQAVSELGTAAPSASW